MKYTLTDSHATPAAIGLYNYLMDVMVDRRLLFGQQNGSFQSVSDSVEADVRQLTGTLPAIIGIDTMALTGFESTTESPEAAMNMALSISEKAAAEGCILTMTAHMPNFSGESITKRSDGTYDFTLCEFLDARDHSHDIAHEILPGGRYADVFRAYLDVIAVYMLELDKREIPLIFRPFHESNRNCSWWGSDVDADTVIALYRYTREYLLDKGVHNVIYAYAPVGPIRNEAEYLDRYPGDDCVDILAVDYYDRYHYKEKFHKDFFADLYETCEIVSRIAESKHKLSALSETGLKIAKDPEETDLYGMLEHGNPVLGRGWFKTVAKIAIQHGMPYYMTWANFERGNACLPYITEDGMPHELTYEFLDMYHWEPVIFASGVKRK